MNQYFGLMNTIAEEFQILKGTAETEKSWKARILYSYLGQVAYSSLFDIQEDLEHASIIHFKSRISESLSSMLEMYPDLQALYGADDVREGVAIMHLEGVDVSITGNSTNPTRFQHPVAATYKKECVLQGKKYFSVASGGGTGRTLHPDNMAAGPASYGMTDTMGRMHSDAQFAGSSSVPAHVEMMGLIGMGNNPMVGASVAVAVAVEEAMKK